MRRALLAALLGTALLAFWVMHAHYAERDETRAVLAVRTKRFAGNTRSRVGTYLRATRPGVELVYSVRHGGPFADAVEVGLEAGADRYRFRVVVGDRSVEPLDDPTRALVESIRAFGRE